MIFVDTGPLIARHLPDDQHHQDSVVYWDVIEAERIFCLTTSLVISEAITLLGRRDKKGQVAARARQWLTSKALAITRPDADDQMSAVDWFEKYADQQIGFADCVSFAVMTRRRLSTAFTFDKHFAVAGFQVVPPRPF